MENYVPILEVPGGFSHLTAADEVNGNSALNQGGGERKSIVRIVKSCKQRNLQSLTPTVRRFLDAISESSHTWPLYPKAAEPHGYFLSIVPGDFEKIDTTSHHDEKNQDTFIVFRSQRKAKLDPWNYRRFGAGNRPISSLKESRKKPRSAKILDVAGCGDSRGPNCSLSLYNNHG